MSMVSEQSPPVRQAGTLIVARPRAGDGVPEFVMARRAETMRFAPGAMVFPGGAVDAADRALAEILPSELGQEDMAARIAALREAIEECGLLLADAPAHMCLSLRAALHGGEGLDAAARRHDVRLDFGALIPFARWCPMAFEARIRFDTRFYIAPVPAGWDQPLTPDGSETMDIRWTSAMDMLAKADAGEAHIIFPTRCNLERLAQFRDMDALIAGARAQQVSLVSPWIEMREGAEHICITENCGYPVTARPAHLAVRG